MKLPNLIRHEFPRKLTAIIFAGLIFGIVHIQLQETEVYTNVAVNLRPEGKNIMLLHDGKLTTTLTVRGTRRNLNKIKTNPLIEHLIPATTTEPGFYSFRLRADDITLPPGVKIAPNGIQPRKFEVEIDQIVHKEVDIRLRINREGLPSGLTIRRITIHPKKVTITGPKKLVKDITEIVSEEVEFDQNPPQNYEIDVALVEKPRISLARSEVHVSIELSRSKDIKPYRQIPVEALTRHDGGLYIMEFLDTPKVDVTLEGPAATLDVLTAEFIHAFVELKKGDGVGVRVLRVRVWINAKDCTWRKITPAALRVKIGRRPIK